MFAPVAVALAVGLLGWAYKALKPPPPKICGSPDGPRVTSARVKLSDGRHLAYRESGVQKEEAKYKIIVIHGYNSSKDLDLPVPQELIKELKIYFLFFDRAGYGDSDPYPSRSVKSEAFDIQELADLLQIGSKFFVIGASMGGYAVWSCLKYIPHRPCPEPWLLGASLLSPFVHYWWPRVPANLSKEGFRRLRPSYQWSFRIAHYTPWLFYWWMTQKWFPTLSTEGAAMFNDHDIEILKRLSEAPSGGQEKITQQGEYESLHRDIMVGYASWEFDPTDITNPFPENEVSVHIWQAKGDRVIPFQINSYLSEKLPWIHYHEVPEGGHLIFFRSDICEAVIRSLLLG